MTKIVVTSDLKTHVAEIDDQHQELFDRINAVATITTTAVMREQAIQTLDFLGAYIDKHFGDEEELQRRYNYPKHTWHKEMHRWYIAEFNSLKNEYDKNGVSVEFVQLLEQSITNWIVRHIGTVDVELGRHINQQINAAK